MDIITGIVTLVSSLVTGFTDKQKADLTLALQQDENISKLMESQARTNEAEANAPNRKWITWRELLGYCLAVGVGWNVTVQPMLISVFLFAGKTLDVTKFPQLDMQLIVYLVCGMLGIPVAQGMYNYAKGKIKR